MIGEVCRYKQSTNFHDFCEIRGGINQKIGTPCLDFLIYKEILEVFDGKWAKGTVGTVKHKTKEIKPVGWPM